MPTAKQKRSAVNKMYYQVHQENIFMHVSDNYVTNSNEEKVTSRAYSKAT